MHAADHMEPLYRMLYTLHVGQIHVMIKPSAAAVILLKRSGFPRPPRFLQSSMLLPSSLRRSMQLVFESVALSLVGGLYCLRSSML